MLSYTTGDRIDLTQTRRMLEGKTVLITGASRGIGSAIALAFAEHGANVAVNYNSSLEAAEEVAQRCGKHEVSALAVRGDVTRADDVARVREEIHEGLGEVDVLVNNAGVNVDSRFQNMTDEAWEKVVDTNLTSAYRVTRAFLEDVTRRPGGRIVNVASFVGQRGNYGQANYAASKGGLIAFTKTLAVELARTGTTVNAVAPGFTETEMLQKVPDRVREKLLADIPLGRFAKPEEVAHAVTFLAGPMAAYVTGEVLNVNGGIYLG